MIARAASRDRTDSFFEPQTTGGILQDEESRERRAPCSLRIFRPARPQIWRDEAPPFRHDPQMFRNCVERDSNADIMAVIRLVGEEYRQLYLSHPLHLQMAGDLRDTVIGRTSFDHL